MNKNKNTAILLGTSNKNGNTSALVDVVATNINASVFKLEDYVISPFDYDHKNIDDDFIPLVKKLLEFDHIIFASPVYWYTMSAQMKIFFDRLSDLLHIKKELGRKLRGKTTSVLATGASPQAERSFEEVFINSFNYLSMDYEGMLYCYCEQKFVLSEHEKGINHLYSS
jgi:multimeric flavodoxin WrbA